jgi:hypothetical protein
MQSLSPPRKRYVSRQTFNIIIYQYKIINETKSQLIGLQMTSRVISTLPAKKRNIPGRL